MADGHLDLSGSSHHSLTHHHHHHHVKRHRIPSGGEDQGEEEELDPRIQVELEKLNRASEEINKLELELDDARASFRQVLSDSTQRLNGLAKKLGTCVDKTRPYYDARMKLKEAHLESQKAALRFERACSMHEAAKEMVQLAEEGYKRREQDLDPTWQEMLNHATMKVNDAERERMESEKFHQQTTSNFKKREEEVQKLQSDLKRSITKSKPYFEMKAKFNQVMEDHKQAVSNLEERVGSTKSLYSEALRNLEAISDDIHRQRLERKQKLQLGVRGMGVGAEAPSPPPSWDKGANIDGRASSEVFDSDVDPASTSEGWTCGQIVEDAENRSELKGIVYRDLPYRKRTSLSERHIQEGNFRIDPLNVVVFKTPSPESRSSESPARSSDDFHPPSVIFNHPDRSRSSSYRAAIESGIKDGQGRNENVAEGSEERVTGARAPIPGRDSAPLAKSHEHSSPPWTGKEPRPESPKNSLHHDVDLNKSSLSRAQEWVNKSPIPQQRRFVKSKSLVNAASPGLSAAALSPIDFELSASISTELTRGGLRKSIEDSKSLPLPPVTLTSLSSSVLSQQRSSPVNILAQPTTHSRTRVRSDVMDPSRSCPLVSSSTYLTSPRTSGHSQASTPEQSSPLSGSPSTQRKSPKLQGLILRVDAAGIGSSGSSHSPPLTATSKSQSPAPTTSQTDIQNKVLISTQHPGLGLFVEKKAPIESADSDDPQVTQSSSSSSATLSNFSSMSSPPTCAAASSIPSSKPPTSLMSKIRNSTTKVYAYNSKTAPSVLSTSYELHPRPSQRQASPTRGAPTSPSRQQHPSFPASPSAALRPQLKSPTPPSPSNERFHSSGRSDCLSATSGSHRTALLRVPSDHSSDTESIASTGPMLDDDQVEFLTLDFNEQSIAREEADEEQHEYAVDTESIRRGNWARMSLPPRLSFLEGYLERTRHISSGRNIDATQGDDRVLDSNNNKDNESDDYRVDDDARSSVAASGGDLEDKSGDFKDEYSDVDGEESEREAEQTESSCGSYVLSTMEAKFGAGGMLPSPAECDVVVNIQVPAEDGEVDGGVVSLLDLPQDSHEEQSGELSTEATFVLSPEGDIMAAEGDTSPRDGQDVSEDAAEVFV